MKAVIIFFTICLGAVMAQMGMPGMGMPGGMGMPQPMPMGMPMMGGGPQGFQGQPDQFGGPNMGFNPFMGPNGPAPRNMNLQNREQRPENARVVDNDKDAKNVKNNKDKPKEQARSGTDSMLDNMGLHGIQDFYAALTGELARNPSGYQNNANSGAPQESINYRRRK